MAQEVVNLYHEGVAMDINHDEFIVFQVLLEEYLLQEERLCVSPERGHPFFCPL